MIQDRVPIAMAPAMTLVSSRVSTFLNLRQIVKTIRQLEGSGGDFIAIIAARPVLDKISEKKMKIGERLLTLREYSATNIEEAIIAAVRAERDGASALVCAPIVSPTVEKLLTTYNEVDAQADHSSVASDIQSNIVEVLHSVNTAFENLEDNLLQDTAMDISSEISALETMLAQDGLHDDELSMHIQ